MVELFKEMIDNTPNDIEILQCKVLTISPLTIQVVDQPKRQIPNDFLMLTRSVTKYKVDMKMDGIIRNVEVDNALRINDIILVVGFNNAQKFVVIDRVV